MEKEIDIFLTLLDKESKEESVKFAMDYLKKPGGGIKNFYLKLMLPAMQKWDCKYQDDSLCIWKEHVRSQIFRTIIECSYQYLIEEKKNSQKASKKIIFLCPCEEFHDLGLKITSDLFELSGFDVVFAGSNTPQGALLRGIEFEKPDLAAISVSSSYNIVAAKKMIKAIKEKVSTVKIIVGGSAFTGNEKLVEEIGADFYIPGFSDIENIFKAIKRGDR